MNQGYLVPISGFGSLLNLRGIILSKEKLGDTLKLESSYFRNFIATYPVLIY